MKKIITIVFTLSVIINGCKKIAPAAPNNDDVLDGPLDGLSHIQAAQHLKGDIAFNDQVFTSETGLGSIFVASSCGSCHAGDGKGHPSTTLIRFGQTDSSGNKFLGSGGPQLQSRAMPGFKPEEIPAGATFSKFTPPANTGLGFIELVSDADILAMQDPYDINNDGISGVPNWISAPTFITPHSNAVAQNGKYIHRFGKKGAAYNLLHQTVNAYNQDMGITSAYNPKDVFSLQDVDAEITTQTILDVVFYLQTLKAPVQRNQNDAAVKNGNQLFIAIGCEKCHKKTLKTQSSSVEALNTKEFHPYTDLLLHDMGNELDDGYTEGSAKTYEWRTPALWGLGLSPNSQGGNYYLMHDGRAQSIEQAIQLHAGEANLSKEKFEFLSNDDKNDLLKFLKSL